MTDKKTTDEIVAELQSLGLWERLTGVDRQRLDALQESRIREVESLGDVMGRLRVGDLVEACRRAEPLPETLADRLEKALTSLGGHILRIQDQSLEVAVVGGEVQSTSTDLASGFSEQSAAVVEITATIEELARTAAQIAQNAEHQAELAEQAQADGVDGAQAVLSATEGLEALRQRITGIAERADSLGSRSKEIYRILDLISEIAHDTHILSLNAAIEAETAGEHGRRFAVVAEEVRRLAQRARESVQTIRSHLEEFSGAIRSTVVATEEGTKEAELVLEQARASQEAIDELRTALGETAQAAKEISLATKEQRTASDQVAATIKEVREVIQRMADGLRNFGRTAGDLNEHALTIQMVTQAFRFASPRSLKHVLQEKADGLADLAPGWESLPRDLDRLVSEWSYAELVFVTDANARMLEWRIHPDWGKSGSHGIEHGKDYSERPWFAQLVRQQTAVLTELYDSLLTTEKCFTVAAPIRGPEGQLLGILGADINLRSWVRI